MKIEILNKKAKIVAIREGFRNATIAEEFVSFVSNRYEHWLDDLQLVEIVDLEIPIGKVGETIRSLSESLRERGFYVHAIASDVLWIGFPGLVESVRCYETDKMESLRVHGESRGIPRSQMQFECLFNQDHPARRDGRARKIAPDSRLKYFDAKSPNTENGLATFSGRVRNITENGGTLIAELVLREKTIRCNIPSMPGPELGDMIAIRGHKNEDESFNIEEWSILERPCSREAILLRRSNIRNAIEVRRKVIRVIRQFFDSRGFLEMETSILLPTRDIAPVLHFEINGQGSEASVLRICPENQLKRLVGAGYDRVYEISRNFRNEESDEEHLPEFTSIECYLAYANYKSMIDILEELVHLLWKEIKGYEFSNSWKRIDFTEASYKLGVDFTQTKTPQELLELLRLKGIGLNLLPETVQWIDVYGELAGAIEKTFDGPTHLMNHPAETICVAKRHDDRPHLIERFEAFVNGKEIAHGFTELVDPIEQRSRMNELLNVKAFMGNQRHPLDEEFLGAMELMPPMAGLGIGIDRLVMLLTELPIHETVPFPLKTT